MQLKKLRFLIAALLLAVAMATVACSNDDDEEEIVRASTPTPDDQTPAGPELLPQPAPVQPISSEVTAPNDGVVNIGTSGSLFQQNNIAVVLGEPATIKVTNEDVVAHNLRIAGLDGKFATEDDAVTVPEAIDSGGVGELTFAPPVPGTYTFQCDFHPTSMGGQIVVE